VSAAPCPHCEGSGLSPVARALKDKWYGDAEFHPQDRGSTPFLPDHPIIRALAERNARPNAELGCRGCDADREACRLARHFNARWSHHLNDDDVAALLKARRLVDLTHDWKPGEGWRPKEPAVIPTAAEINEWSLRGFGHDAMNQWVVVEAECLRLGLPYECEHCGGEGETLSSDEGAP
jgi:hypothetical protein